MASASPPLAPTPGATRALTPPAGSIRPTKQRDSIGSWPLADRIAYLLCWIVGIGLCVMAGAIVLFMLVKGVSYLRPSLLIEHPSASQDQATSGGFLDPIEGTLILTAVGWRSLHRSASGWRSG